MRRQMVVVVLLMGGALVGCGEDGPSPATANVADPSTAPVVASSSGPTVPPASAVPPTLGNADPTTAPVVESSTTIPAPVTTLLSELGAGFAATQDAAYACLAAIATCSADAVAVPGSPAHEYFAELIELYRVNGYEARLHPEASHDTILATETGADGRSGVVTACSVDGHWVVEPASAVGGLDTIVNDEVVTRQIVVELRLTDAGWRRWEIVPVQEWPGDTPCVA